MKLIFLSMCFAILLCAVSAFAQQSTSPSLLTIGDKYWMQPDVVYGSANNTPLKLDIWYPRDNPTPTPTLVYIHGGGWIFGSKEGSSISFFPISNADGAS
jgi:acetyl esterase/lipase